ncbi:MAG TPA: hypothetical protein VIF57_05745 [Polyangia bacterium]|jgi:hypothetical protein
MGAIPPRTLRALLPAVLAVAWPATARAWGTTEHQEIGRAGYLRACADLTSAVTAKGAPPPAVAARLEIACGRNLATAAEIYGDATALAGDFLDEPSEFFSQAGAWRFKSRTSYWRLALENSAHFNPMATQSWAQYHAAAIAEALKAAADSGLAEVTGLQLALQESAFADHYLQDSFAAGHMGFNRTASSAAAAKSFHDAWNERGRIVSSRNGDRWLTFGDGTLGSPRNAAGRTHVMDAAAMSVRGVLGAFIVGERSPDEELAVWRMLPFAIQAPELSVDMVEIFERPAPSTDRALVPLVTTLRPARKDTVLTGKVWSAAPFSDADHEIIAAVAGLELALPRIPLQSHLGAGGTLREPGGSHSAVIDTGVLVPLGVSLRTLVSHQLNLTASWMIRNHLAAVLHGAYQLNVELGDVLVSLQGGLAELLPDARTGWYAAVGAGLAFSAAGGGGF